MESISRSGLKVSFAIALLSFALGACTQKNDAKFGIQPRPEVRAALTIQSSFAVEPLQAFLTTDESDTRHGDLPMKTDQVGLWIQKDALEKEFLLQIQLVSQRPAPAFEGQKSRVVAFRHRGQSVFLMEAVQGHVVSPDLPANLLLAEFPILSETETALRFDFNKGMSQLFVGGDIFASDLEQSGTTPSTGLSVLPIEFSYIDNAKISNGRLEVRQIAQVKTTDNSGNRTQIEALYYVQPYSPNPSFVPSLTTNFERMGFFEVAPRYAPDGAVIINATKYDLTKPIVYAISANTPKEMHEAVREGILYWNKAFGREQIKVIDAPEGVRAPSVDYNIVQWIDWEDAGSAYADMQMDPRSGEILHSQVFMTSAFSFGGKNAAQRLLRQLRPATEKSYRIGLKGFSSTVACDYHISEHQADGLQKLIDTNDNAAILRVAQDYVRSVVAHEVGHTLGLRHNFAGSLAASYPLSEREGISHRYLHEGVVAQGVVTSSSIMEYQIFDEAAITGHQILTEPKTLTYDETAIQSLYLGKSYRPEELPLFCTDSHPQFLDCARFDTGGSLVEHGQWAVRRQLDALPYTLLYTYIKAKATRSSVQPTPIENVVLDAQTTSSTIMATQYSLARSLSESAEILRVHRSFPSTTGVQKKYVDEAEAKYLSEEFARLGGFSKVFAVASSEEMDELLTRFNTLIDDPNNQKGEDGNGRTYQFSADEIAIMKENVKRFFEQLPNELLADHLAAFLLPSVTPEQQTKYIDHELVYEFAGYIAHESHAVLLTTRGEPIATQVPGPDNTAVSVELPVFAYPYELRLLSSTTLQASNGRAVDWAIYPRKELRTAQAEMMKNTFKGIEVSTLKAEDMPRPVGRWLIENRTLLNSLTQ